MENGYDIIAFLCHKIWALSSKQRQELYKQYYGLLNQGDADEMVESNLPFLNKLTGKIVMYDDFSPDEIHKMYLWIDTGEAIHWICLASYLDKYIDFENSFYHFLDLLPQPLLGHKYFKSLSQNSDGILLPNFSPRWRKEKIISPDALNYNPLSILKHYLWVDDISHWKVTNIYNSYWNWDNSLNADYRIVCSPLTNVHPFLDDCCDKDSSYCITKYFVKEQQNIKQRIDKVLDYANEKMADIVLFPEVMLSRESQKEVQQLVKDKWQNEYPKIIFLASSAFKDEKGWKNQSIILNDQGDQIAVYNKQNPYQHIKRNADGTETKYFEPIIGDDEIVIFHIKGVGRIALMICSDVLCEELMKLLYDKYNITIGLVMSYTGGIDQFERNLSQAVKNHCEVVWCNTCAAYNKKPNGRPATVYFSYGHKDCDRHPIAACSEPLCVSCATLITIKSSYNQIGGIEKDVLE